MSPEYLAGFFDGEGCVNLTVSGASRGVALRVMLVNTDYEFLQEIQREYGGILTEKASTKANWKNFCQIRWNNNFAAEFLCVILPHLRLKKKQAELALEFIESRYIPGRLIRLGRTTMRTPEGQASDEAFKRRMHELNRRGLNG